MDYALQVHESKYIFPIPDGLKELSSDIIREVLRHQPGHINGFIADYLETMLIVRDRARDSGVVICEAFQEACFFDELLKIKNITREQAIYYATVIQAAWRGYVVRRKVSQWLKKKKKFEEEKERKRSLKIEELLAGLGITYDEAKRAAGVIQVAYRSSKDKGSGDGWMVEDVPLGQRIREGDRVHGRFDRWEKEDFGDFFEIDESGGIKYIWPKVGQIRKVLREEIPKDVPIVEFFAMRDLEGQEQYSYLIKTQPDTETRGVPIGFLVPIPRCAVAECSQAEFVKDEHNLKMGDFTYVYRDDVDRNELKKFEELLKSQGDSPGNKEMPGETEYDPSWVLPRVLVRIKKNLLLPTDDEVKFVNLTDTVLCDCGEFTFRAETLEQTVKVIQYILKNKCQSMEEALLEASNISPYKIQEVGRIFPVETFTTPTYIQKIEITPESDTAEDESLDLMRFNYIYLPPGYVPSKSLPKGEPCFSISIIRFQGFHSDFKGSAVLENKVFIMGPKMTTPDGKPFTHESLFWEDFGIEAWYQFLHDREREEQEEEEKEGEYAEEEKTEELPLKEVEEEKLQGSEIGESREAITEVTEVEKGLEPFSAPPSETVIEAGEEKPYEEKVEEHGEEKQEEKVEPKKESETEQEKEAEPETKPDEEEPKTEET